MNGLPPNSELVMAAYYFLADPKSGRERQARAIELTVKGPLHDRLQRAARNALAARPGDWPLVREALGEMIQVIRRGVERRQAAERERQPEFCLN
jgi:hypothetical protein